MAEPVRLQRVIADAGLMSRRAAEEMVREGRVAVDGATARLGDRVDVDVQQVTLDGIPLPVNPGIETHLLYKPDGVISSAHDPQGRPTVVDLVPSSRRLYPVGRLDFDSEGLILVSNDGELTNLVTHPRFGIDKRYVALVHGRVERRTARRLVEGVELEDGPARALSARIVDRKGDDTMIEMVMGEGRNREIRRMFQALGLEVRRLVRTGIGPISDRGLKPGESRLLTPVEVRKLYQTAKESR